MKTVQTIQVQGVMVFGRLHMATEACCPYCEAKATYVHVDTHLSAGNWYSCKHIRAANYDDSGYIDSVEFSDTP